MRYGDEVIVETEVPHAHARMVTFEYRMKQVGDGALLATGYTKHVFLGRNLQPCRLPAKYRVALGISH